MPGWRKGASSQGSAYTVKEMDETVMVWDVAHSRGLASVCESTVSFGVARQAFNNAVHEKADISPEMEIRLSKVSGSTPDTRVWMQGAFDLAVALKDEKGNRVERINRIPRR